MTALTINVKTVRHASMLSRHIDVFVELALEGATAKPTSMIVRACLVYMVEIALIL